jgi:hypothetical protein
MTCQSKGGQRQKHSVVQICHPKCGLHNQLFNLYSEHKWNIKIN